MRLPNRPTSIAELKERIDSGELRESRVLEFKSQFPNNNRALARAIAGLAAEGGVLVIGVAEVRDGLEVATIDCDGARERVENIARDIPRPPVQLESHILVDDAPGRGLPAATPPAAELPAATPTATELPAATPPVTELPAVTPPAAELPAVTPPAAELPAATPPVTELPAATPTAAELPAVTPPAAELPAATPPVTELPAATPTAAELPAATPSASETPTPTLPTVRTTFGDGTYLVPEEVAPGAYVTSDAQALCRVYDHRSVRVAGGSGTITLTVLSDWSSIRVSNCGTFRPHTPTVRTTFGDGTYLVPEEVAPGAYVTSDAQALCRVYDHRSAPVAGGSGTITLTVLSDWSSIRVSNCGTFRPHTPTVRTTFGDGTYLVPEEVAPGAYVTSDAQALCRVYDHRSARVAGGSGTITLTVLSDWSSIRVSNCGTFRPHTPTVRTTFGDGTYLVPEEVAPGAYVTSDAQALCRVYDHRSARVAGGSGTITLTVLSDWSSIRVSNCGTFRPHTPTVRTTFGDGTYLVPEEVAPGAYVTSDAQALCRVYDHRSARVAGGSGTITLTVLSDWSSIRVSNCGTFRRQSAPP